MGQRIGGRDFDPDLLSNTVHRSPRSFRLEFSFIELEVFIQRGKRHHAFDRILKFYKNTSRTSPRDSTREFLPHMCHHLLGTLQVIGRCFRINAVFLHFRAVIGHISHFSLEILLLVFLMEPALDNTMDIKIRISSDR